MALIDELTKYIKNNLKKGYTVESLRWALINQGYSKIEIEKALRKVDIELANKAPQLKSKPEIKYEIIEPEGFSSIHKKHEIKSFWKKLFS
jgi:SOS response regulatory protein OraA/RecX